MFPSPVRCVTAVVAAVLACFLLSAEWSIAVAQSSETLIPISALQGSGAESPYYHEWVDTAGLVTGVTSDGFYLQDPTGDDDPQTSDGLFVYTQSRPRVDVGACVLLRRAFVDEYYEKTELSRSKVPESYSGCAGKAVEPVRLSAAQLGRAPSALYEQYEGMVVALDDLRGLVQGPTKRFDDGEAEIALLPEEWAPYLDGGRVFQWQADAMPALMYISNALQVESGGDLPELNWGDRLLIGAESGDQDAVVGILDYNFGKYQFMPLPGHVVRGESLDRLPQSAEATVASAETDDSFTVCTFNLLGMGTGSAQYPDPAEYEQQMRKRALAIAQELDGCTIIGLQETGSPDDVANLAAMLAADFGLDYAVAGIEGPGTASFEFPLTNTLLARRDRVRILGQELRQGCSRFNYDVKYMPGVCERLTFGLFNRPPLVVDMEVTTAVGELYPITVIVNHWKSKGGDETVNVVRRTDQAEHVASLVQERVDAAAAAGEPVPNVVVLGDLNDYYRSGPVEALRTGVTPPLAHSYDALREQNRYTYIFNGGSQVLDHILMTDAMAGQVGEIRPVHINADFAYPAVLDSDSVHHSSDHDPVLMRVAPQGRSWLGGMLHVPGITVALSDASQAMKATVVTDDNGEFRFWNLTPGAYRVTLSAPALIHPAESEFMTALEAGGNRLPSVEIEHGVVAAGVAAALRAPAQPQ